MFCLEAPPQLWLAFPLPLQFCTLPPNFTLLICLSYFEKMLTFKSMYSYVRSLVHEDKFNVVKI